MKLSEIVCSEAIIPQLKSATRNEVIRELTESLVTAGQVKKSDVAAITEAIIKREKEGSTGIGKGVAIPHVKHASVKKVVAAVGVSGKGIDFSSLDKQPVYSVILLLSPADNPDRHLQAMETVFRNLHKDDFRRFLRQSGTVEQIRDIITEADEGSF